MITKKALRKKLLSYRLALPNASYDELNKGIYKNLILLEEIKNANTIHCFWPIIEKREIDTAPFIKTLVSLDKQVVLPVVTSFKDGINIAPRMVHRRFEGETNLITNRWGVKEPAQKKPFPVEDLDAVVVPALGVARNGTRLGYGKGYYDEFSGRV